MAFIKKLNIAFKKIRKIGWKLTLIILLIFFSANPYYLSDIPFVYESFIYANDIYYTVMDFIYRGFEYPVLGSILGFHLASLQVVALCIVALWVVSLIGVPVTNLIIKAPEKKKAQKKPGPSVKPIKRTPRRITPIEKPERPVKPMTIENIQEAEASTNTSEPVRRPVPPRSPSPAKNKAPARNQQNPKRGSSKLMTILDKIISFIRLNILKIDSKHVFFREGDSYIRVQRFNVDENINAQYKAEELLVWNSQNSISIPFTFKGENGCITAYRTADKKSAFFGTTQDLEETELIPNTPASLWIPNENNEEVLVMVITWIGDVFND